MEANKEAKELIDKFYPYVHGYIGSSMLSNYEYVGKRLEKAKTCALISLDDRISMINEFPENISCHITPHLEAVKQEIINYKE